MKVQISDQEYVLTDASIHSMLDAVEVFAAAQYNKLPDTAKLAAMAGIRAILAWAERAEKDPEKKKEIRPPKGVDPSLHLVKLLLKHIGEVLPNVECEITTDEQRITNFTFKHAGESRGSLSADGHERIGQDNGGEAVGSQAGEALPIP